MKAIIVCEGYYAETVEFRDNQHYWDFLAGFTCGAGHYGAGGFGIYTLDDLTEDPDLDANVIALINEHLK